MVVMAFKLRMCFSDKCITEVANVQKHQRLVVAIFEIYNPARSKEEITNDNWKTGYEQFSLLYR